MSLGVIIIITMLMLSALFSGMEIAYVSANKIHLELEKKQNNFLSNILRKLTAKPSKFIATMLIGNNIALVIYGFFAGDLLTQWFASFLPSQSQLINTIFLDFNLLTQTVITTLVILITAEFFPKVFFQIYANTLIKTFALPAYIFYVIFRPISAFVIWITDLILKYLFKTQGDQMQLVFTKVELGNYISEQMESVESQDVVDTEIQIFQNALEFSEVKAREVMVPRTEITAIEINDSLKTLSALFTETGYTKILVYKENIDEIVGYVHSFELFKKPKDIKSIVLPVEFVPETVLIKDVLSVLIKKHKSLAVVLDEYGGTSGIVAVEDIVEVLFGDIEDEHDTDDLVEEVIDEHTYKFSARLEVDYLNETYRLNLPENENYETLGGLILNYTQEIPTQNYVVSIANFQFIILEVSNTKIDLVQLKQIDDD